MENKNQIKRYHDLTAFWLDREWKTPREKLLEKELAQLRQQLEGMRPLMDIPCNYCGKSMGNDWDWEEDRGRLLQLFKGVGLHHSECKPKY